MYGRLQLPGRKRRGVGGDDYVFSKASWEIDWTRAPVPSLFCIGYAEALGRSVTVLAHSKEAHDSRYLLLQRRCWGDVTKNVQQQKWILGHLMNSTRSPS